MSQQLSSNFGEQTEHWHGVDVSLNARLRNGLTVQGGTSSGAPPAGQLRDPLDSPGDLHLGQHHCGADDARHHHGWLDRRH